MKHGGLQEIEKWLKSSLKRKVSISEKTLVAFLIAGVFGFVGENAFAGYNNDKFSGTQKDGNWNVSFIDGAGAGTTSDGNFAAGFNAGTKVTGGQNTVLGVNAGQNVSGDKNFAAGDSAGNNVSGNWNTAIGREAGQNVSGGSDNVALGYAAGKNVTGTHNFSVMNTAGQNVTGHHNTSIGRGAGQSTSGNHNVSLGELAGKGRSGDENVSLGYSAGIDSVGWFNIAIGNESGQRVGNNKPGFESNNQTTGMGRNNIAIGRLAGNGVQGNENIAIGARVGENVGARSTNNSTGIYNVALGVESGNNVEGVGNVTLGRGVGNETTGSYNFIAGHDAGNKIAGNENIILGNGAGKGLVEGTNITKADYTISVGTETLASKNNVTAVGYKAKAIEEKTLALGGNATSDVANSVALGDDSDTEGTASNRTKAIDNTYISENINNKLELMFAGGDQVKGVVSVGNGTSTRRIQNVAPGLLSETSTDAVNGSQLYALADKVSNLSAANSVLSFTGDNYDANTEAAQNQNKNKENVGKVDLANQKLAINGTEDLITTTVAKDGTAVTINIADAFVNKVNNKADKSEIKTYVVEAGKNVVVDPDNKTAGTVKYTVNGQKTVVVAGNGLKMQTSTEADKDNNYTNTYTLALADDLKTKLDNLNNTNPDTYFHVNNGTNKGTGSATTNLGKVNEAAGATALNALTAGVNANASGANAVAVGFGANSSIENGVAIGNGASVNNNQGTPGTAGIAIGKNAQSHQMSSAMHEVLVKFKREKANMTGGIAIGQDTHARISTIDIGNRDYVGKIGDIEFNKNGSDSWNSITGVGTTTLGDNSINTTNFSTISGAFNTITNSQKNGNQFHNLGKAMQGFGSSIVGTLNSIEGNENLVGSGTGRIDQILVGLGVKQPATGLMYSGTASNTIGIANRISKSNGALIYGAGNEITNSYLTPRGANEVTTLVGASFLDPNNTGVEIKELSDAFRKYMNKQRLGSVGIIGGANKADYALFSSINGVGNTLTGSGATSNLALNENNTTNTKENQVNFAAFNQINGYENKGTNVSHTVLTGSWNEVENASKNIVTGNNHIIKGTVGDKAVGNIVLGFNEAKDEDNFKTSAKNIVAIGNDIVATQDNSVYLGNKSKDAEATATKGMTEYSKDTVEGLNLTFAGGKPAGIVSVGATGEERRVENVAAGWISETSTDAINGSQLYAVAKALKNDVKKSVEGIKPVEVLAGTNVTVTPDKKEGDDKVVTYTVNAEKTTVSSGDETLITVTEQKDNKTNVTNYTIDLKDEIKQQIKGSTFRETVVAGKSGNVTVEDKDIMDKGVKTGKEFTVELAKDIDLTKEGSVTIGDTVVNNNGLTINNGPSITNVGIDAGDKIITNVKAGEKDTDAVNVSQLKEVKQIVNNYGDAINHNSQRIDTLNGKVNSGLANAAAMSALEFQEIGINQAVVAAGVGTFNGYQAVAVGMETAPTENVRVNVKASIAPGSRRGVNTMAGIGASYKFNWK